MQFNEKSNTIRWFIIVASFLIVLLILWNTYIFFQIFKNEERIKMELWVKALKTVNKADFDDNIELPSEIISNNTSIPIIITNKEGKIIKSANIDEQIVNDSIQLTAFLDKLKSQNKPLKLFLFDNEYQLIYYGDSSLINQLKYYPVALFLIILLFGAVVYNFYRATKMATQNKLWAAMAKETAHQIGTPLSSLIGWLEILKLDQSQASTVEEIQKDIQRLQTITDRFSKVGSEPVLEIKDIITETKATFDYLKDRSSKQIHFSFLCPEKSLKAAINPTLHSWTIENLIKNAIDAMKGKGELVVEISETDLYIKINVTDSGKGIPKAHFSKVFEPGFTTKKRGWGLGLSLTKRIVQEYHKGRVIVAHSEMGKGTTMQISYKKEV